MTFIGVFKPVFHYRQPHTYPTFIGEEKEDMGSIPAFKGQGY